MNKLTTERLEQFIANPLGNPLYRTEQMDMAHQLLAYERAAKNEVALPEALKYAEIYGRAFICVDRSGSVHAVDPSQIALTILNEPAPVLPKQPELVENLKKVMNNWLAMEPKLAFQPEFTDVMMLLDAEPVPAQPVIPEQTERERIRREHAEWSDATFGNVGPVGPLKHLSKEALEAAADPSDSLEWADMQFLLWDAQRRMGISDDFITKAMIEKLEINKKRQWPEPKDGEPRLHINTQSAQLVSEPYKLKDAVADIRNSGVEIDADKIKAERDALNSPVIPDGWKLVPIEPTAAMFHAFNDCDYGRKSMRERYIQMIEAAPAQESE